MANAYTIDTTTLPFVTVVPRPKRSWQDWGWRVVALFLGASLIAALSMSWTRCDFETYYRAAARIATGQSPYCVDDLGYLHTYRYPPAFACAITPLTHFDVAWAGRIWFIGIWISLAACFYLSLFLIWGPRPWPAEAGTAALLTFLACSCYLCQNLFQGQVGIAMTLACLGWAVCQRVGRPFSGGLLLAVGCALKLAPIVIVPYLLIRKDWRGLAGLALGGALVFLTPSLWVGWDRTVELHQEWLHHAQATQIAEQSYRSGNQGLLAQLARLPAISNGLICYSSENLTSLERNYPVLVLGLGVVLYIGLFNHRLKRSRDIAPDAVRSQDNLHLILLLIYMTLANPCAWRCNYATLILPCLLVARLWVRGGNGAFTGRVVLSLVAMGWAWPIVLTLINLANWSSFGDATLLEIVKGRAKNADWSFAVWLIQGAHFWSALAVAGLCGWMAGQPTPRGEVRKRKSTYWKRLRRKLQRLLFPRLPTMKP